MWNGFGFRREELTLADEVWRETFGTRRIGEDWGQLSWVADHQVSGSHLEYILSPSGHMAIFGDMFRCYNWGRGCY